MENKNIDQNIINIFKDSLVIDPQIQIVKVNQENSTLPSRVTVSSFSQTSSMIYTTSENTIVWSWDTSLLATHPELTTGSMGNLIGTYSVQAKYTLLNQVILTPLFYVIVN